MSEIPLRLKGKASLFPNTVIHHLELEVLIWFSKKMFYPFRGSSLRIQMNQLKAKQNIVR